MDKNKQKRMVGVYSSDCNVIGSIPDYGVLLDYICEKYKAKEDSGFVFRTQKTVERFDKAVESGILRFENKQHESLFINSISGEGFSLSEKMIILFWQMIYANKLFEKLTRNVFMPAMYRLCTKPPTLKDGAPASPE